MKYLKMELRRKLHYFYLSQTPIYLCRFKLLRKLKQTWQLQLMSCSAQHGHLSRNWWTQYKNVMGTQDEKLNLIFSLFCFNFVFIISALLSVDRWRDVESVIKSCFAYLAPHPAVPHLGEMSRKSATTTTPSLKIINQPPCSAFGAVK